MLTKEFLRINVSSFISILAQEPSEYWREDEFLKDLPLKFSLSMIAQGSDKVIGYIIASRKEDFAYIHKFMVHPINRGQGVGYNLLKRFGEICLLNKLPEIQLSVYKSNSMAIEFYTRNGFEIIGERVDKGNYSLLIMRKTLLNFI